MKIHLHNNNSEHPECSTLVRATKKANLGIKSFELDSRSTEGTMQRKYFLFSFFYQSQILSNRYINLHLQIKWQAEHDVP